VNAAASRWGGVSSREERLGDMKVRVGGGPRGLELGGGRSGVGSPAFSSSMASSHSAPGLLLGGVEIRSLVCASLVYLGNSSSTRRSWGTLLGRPLGAGGRISPRFLAPVDANRNAEDFPDAVDRARRDTGETLDRVS